MHTQNTNPHVSTWKNVRINSIFPSDNMGEERLPRLVRVTFHGGCYPPKNPTSGRALKPSSASPSCEARNSKDLSLLNIRRVWCVIEEGLLSSLVDPLVCVPSADWQRGMGVCVGGDRIHLLSAWLYMECFVFASPGQHCHIEVFISRKQVVGVCPSLALCAHDVRTAPAHVARTSHGGRTCVCRHVYECSLSYFSVCVWYLEVCSKGE